MHTLRKITIFTFVLFVSAYGKSAYDFPQKLSINIEDADSSYLYNFESRDSLNSAIQKFQGSFIKYGTEINFRKHSRVIFRYRDPRILPIIRLIATDTTIIPLYRVAAINVLGTMEDTISIPLLTSLINDNNPVISEVAINALGKCGNKNEVRILTKLLKSENNGYLKTTMEAAIRRINGISPAPFEKPFFLDTVSGFIMTSFFFNPTTMGNAATTFGAEYGNIIIQSRSGGHCVFPHQQYKMNPATIFNSRTYAFQPVNDGLYHVGEDSGFFLEGLPVHSIADGVVTGIRYEQSWGFMVTVESNLKMSNTITAIYGHLSKFIDVEVGQKVNTGDKIGDIASPESVENGGYFSHLHWGVAKGGHTVAKKYGYDRDTSNYFDPYELIIRENRNENVDYKRVIFK